MTYYEYVLIVQDRDGRFLGKKDGSRRHGGLTFVDLLNWMGADGWRYVEWTRGALFERPLTEEQAISRRGNPCEEVD